MEMRAEGEGGHPLGARQQGVARVGEGALGGEEQQGVGSDAEGGGGFDGAGGADLGLAHAQQGFFLAEIDFDVPAVEVGFDDELGVEVGIGAEEKGGLAIEQLGTLAQAITEGGDDDQLQDLVGAGGAPHQAGAAFEAQLVGGAVVGEGEGLPGRIVGADLFGSGSGRSVAEAAAARFLVGRIGPEEQMRILAEAADGGGVGGKVVEHGLIGVASIEGDEEPAGGGGRVGVEGGAQLADLFAGALAEAGGAQLGLAVLLLLGGGGFFARLGGSGSMAEGDGDQAAGAVGERAEREKFGESAGRARNWFESAGRAGSRRQATPGVRRPERRRRESSSTAQTGAWGGSSLTTARRTTEKIGSSGKTDVGKEPVTGGPVTKLRSRKW